MAKKPAAKAAEETDDSSLFGPLRLFSLTAENFKRLKAVTIRPDGNVIKITGKNRQGKTSLLDAFYCLFSGEKAITKDAIRDGCQTADVVGQFGHDGELKLTVTRHFSAGKEAGDGYTSKLTVEAANGRRYGSPQAVVNGLFAAIGMDPLAFTRLDEKQKIEAIKSLVRDYDFADAEGRRRKAYESRTDAGRLLDRAKARASGIALPAGPEVKRANVGDLGAELARATEHNAHIDRRAKGRQDKADELEETRGELEKAEARVRALKQEIAATETLINGAEPLPAKIDVAEIHKRLDTIEAINDKAALFEQHAAALKEVKEHEAEYDALTKTIEAIDAEKKDAIAKAKIPVKGLEFDEDRVTLNGKAYADASSAEQITAATLLTMAKNPDLRVVVIREGSLLDSDSLGALGKLAQEHDFDVLIECVTDGERVGFTIEDGELAS